MQILRTLPQLKKLTDDKGLDVVSTGKKDRTLKKDYVKSLQLDSINIIYGSIEKAPEHLKYMIGIESPMLACQYKMLKGDEGKTIWDDPNVIAQTKLDGVRCVMIYSKKEGIHFYSRSLTITSFLPHEFTSIHLGNFDVSKLPDDLHGFVCDAELLCTEEEISTISNNVSRGVEVIDNQLSAVNALLVMNYADSIRIQVEQSITLKFGAFRLLKLNDEDYIPKTFDEQQPVLEKLVTYLNSIMGMNIEVAEYVYTHKKDFYDKIIVAGGEGIILKRRDGVYFPVESRSHRSWIKVKRTAKSSIGEESTLDDTIDAYVTGFEVGTKGKKHEHSVGKLKFSTQMILENGFTQEKEIAVISSLTDEFRESITLTDKNGKPVLKSSIIGRVAEIAGQDFSHRNNKLIHARLVRWRDDKIAVNCMMKESDLLSQVF